MTDSKRIEILKELCPKDTYDEDGLHITAKLSTYENPMEEIAKLSYIISVDHPDIKTAVQDAYDLMESYFSETTNSDATSIQLQTYYQVLGTDPSKTETDQILIETEVMDYMS